MIYKSSINLLAYTSFVTQWKENDWNLAIFTIFSLASGYWNPPKSLYFRFLNFISRSSASEKTKAAGTTRSRPTKTKLPSRTGLAETAFLVGGRTEVDDNRRHHQQPWCEHERGSNVKKQGILNGKLIYWAMNNIRQTCFLNESFNVALVVIIERKM